MAITSTPAGSGGLSDGVTLMVDQLDGRELELATVATNGHA